MPGPELVRGGNPKTFISVPELSVPELSVLVRLLDGGQRHFLCFYGFCVFCDFLKKFHRRPEVSTFFFLHISNNFFCLWVSPSN